MKERRKSSSTSHSDLPSDYTRMLSDVFSANFGDQLKALPEGEKVKFVAGGEIYGDEIVVHVSLVQEGALAATTVLASCDFDPRASSPTVEDLLALCVDGIGDVFSSLFQVAPDSQGNPAILSPVLAELRGAPFEWTQIEISKRKLHLKVDKSNPVLDQAADDWLAKNDPEYRAQLAEQEKEAEDLFVLPPKKGGKGDSGLH